jgi:gliding motility-associated-like protein
VALIASNGVCADTAYATIIGENTFIGLPTVFTPNDDGKNDQFIAKYYGIASLTVEVYSRWGELVFADDQLGFAWDGTFRGEPAQEDVYIWVVTAVGENGFSQQLQGTVLLVR